MHYYFTAVSLIAGVCLGFGILYLFIGLRRKGEKPLSLTFALFALCYAATLFNGVRWYSTTDINQYITINRFDTIFVTGAFVSLIWYISFYTDFQPRFFLLGLSAALIVPGLVNIISPASFTGDIFGLNAIILPWGEKLTGLDSAGSIWLDFVLLVRFVALGYIIFALAHQFRLGEHQSALILGLGMLPFIAGIFYEILGESGLVPYIPFGEFGFLGIAVAASLQMANSIIKTEVALDGYRTNLEGLVQERTAALEAAQDQLVSQARDTAAAAERNRLARDLHDAVTQTIYSASRIAEVLPQVWYRSPEEGKRNLIKLRSLVRGALAEMRTLLFALRPEALTNANLETLLSQLGDALAGRSRIQVQVQAEFVPELPQEVKVTLYRISQEAMNNIAKHAVATNVKVDLLQGEEGINLRIRDDGQGFDPEYTKSSENMGLHIMQERAENIGAQLEINSKSGQGTTVELTWAADAEEVFS